MHSFLFISIFALIFSLIKCSPIYPSAKWKEGWNDELPSGSSGISKSWVQYGYDNDGGKYMENGWQNSWHSEDDDENSAWNAKQVLDDDDWDVSGKHNWFWGNGGSRGWGIWGSGKNDPSRHYGSSIDYRPKNSYISWGSINTNNWKNNGGGEGWSKWEVNDHKPGNGGHEYGEWKGWKVGSGSGKWDSWISSNISKMKA
ncbi:hypothetical protein ACO02O_03910 [Dirofilaria immitis]